LRRISLEDVSQNWQIREFRNLRMNKNRGRFEKFEIWENEIE